MLQAGSPAFASTLRDAEQKLRSACAEFEELVALVRRVCFNVLVLLGFVPLAVYFSLHSVLDSWLSRVL